MQPFAQALEEGRQATEMTGCQGLARMGGSQASRARMGGSQASSSLLSGQRPTALPLASMLEGLAKARHPAAKAATQTPAKQGVTKKRSCNAGKPICMRTNEEENASLRRGASALASLQNGPTKKQRSAEGPRALPLQAEWRGSTRAEPCAAQAPQAYCGFLIAPLP